jgi:hypothetical protein
MRRPDRIDPCAPRSPVMFAQPCERHLQAVIRRRTRRPPHRVDQRVAGHHALAFKTSNAKSFSCRQPPIAAHRSPVAVKFVEGVVGDGFEHQQAAPRPAALPAGRSNASVAHAARDDVPPIRAMRRSFSQARFASRHKGGVRIDLAGQPSRDSCAGILAHWSY